MSPLIAPAPKHRRSHWDGDRMELDYGEPKPRHTFTKKELAQREREWNALLDEHIRDEAAGRVPAPF